MYKPKEMSDQNYAHFTTFEWAHEYNWIILKRNPTCKYQDSYENDCFLQYFFLFYQEEYSLSTCSNKH